MFSRSFQLEALVSGVTIVDARNRKNMQSMVTSDDGRFDFKQVSAGKYSLQGAKRGFIPGSYDEHEQFSTAIVTGAGLDTENLVLRLSPSAVLSGKILDNLGEPVRQAQVSLYREDRSRRRPHSEISRRHYG